MTTQQQSLNVLGFFGFMETIDLDIVYLKDEYGEYVMGKKVKLDSFYKPRPFYISLKPDKRILKIPYKLGENVKGGVEEAIANECKKLGETPQSLLEKALAIYQSISDTSARALNESYSTLSAEKNRLIGYAALTLGGLGLDFYSVFGDGEIAQSSNSLALLSIGVFATIAGLTGLTSVLISIKPLASRKTRKQINSLLKEKNLKAKVLSYDAARAELILKY
jgi:hypothetical protein